LSKNFYNENATQFFDDTVNADLSALYQEFLPLLDKTAHILDAGCGSGRDTRFFIEQGFSVTSFDASEALAKKASEYSGIDVFVDTFENFKAKSTNLKCFDAVWACASLLHVPAINISASFSNLANQLKLGGHFYCSFKYGKNDISRNGRDFTNADEERLSLFIRNTTLVIKKTWISEDVRPERQNEKWLNAILMNV
jgi:SAM-dependent methyltransferase